MKVNQFRGKWKCIYYIYIYIFIKMKLNRFECDEIKRTVIDKTNDNTALSVYSYSLPKETVTLWTNAIKLCVGEHRQCMKTTLMWQLAKEEGGNQS